MLGQASRASAYTSCLAGGGRRSSTAGRDARAGRRRGYGASDGKRGMSRPQNRRPGGGGDGGGEGRRRRAADARPASAPYLRASWSRSVGMQLLLAAGWWLLILGSGSSVLPRRQTSLASAAEKRGRGEACDCSFRRDGSSSPAHLRAASKNGGAVPNACVWPPAAARARVQRGRDAGRPGPWQLGSAARPPACQPACQASLAPIPAHR